MKFRFSNVYLRGSAVGIGFFIFFLLISIASLNMVKNKIWDNSQVMGEAIAIHFADKEAANIKLQEILLRGASGSVKQILDSGHYNRQLIERTLNDYIKNMNSAADIGRMEMCAVIDGQIISTSPAYKNMQLNQLKWYKDALATPGKIVYTNLYRVSKEDSRVLTMAMALGGDNVLAVSMHPQRLSDLLVANDLPEHSFYYLCDENGTILYAISDRQKSIEELQPYADLVLREIKNGEHVSKSSVLQDFDGSKRGVYYKQFDNGWTSIITIPYEYLMRDYQGLLYWYIVTLATFLLFGFVMYIREKQITQRMASMNEAVKVLGNSYHGIYRINVNTGEYTILKATDYVREHASHTGKYADLLKVLLKVVDEEAAVEFAASFSLDNIRKLAQNNVRDFGGDFKQHFPDGYKWSNARLHLDNLLKSGDVILCFKEVDAEKRLQLEHMRLTDEALQSMKKNTESRNMFFSSMSHDMRTPLNGIIGLSELAGKHADDPEKIKDYLKKINVSSKQLLALINDILEMSKLENGKLAANDELTDLRGSIEATLDVFKMQAKNEGKSFEASFEIYHNTVCCDFARISQILNNLLSNAFKYTPANGKIKFSVREIDNQQNTRYQFIVSDTGYGMTEEFLKTVFEPFTRDVRFGAKRIMGTGLGMAIVKSIVDRMEGDIHIESKVGFGTKVTVTLPLVTKEECHGSCGLPRAEKKAAPQEAPADLTGRTILVAEDNEINMEITTELLEMSGLKVIQAWNGREAVECFSESAPGSIDMILMDMQMPELSGCDAAKAIRAMKRPDAASVPIIAVTANAFAEDISATTAAGMNAHISKPIDFKLLQKTMQEFIKNKN